MNNAASTRSLKDLQQHVSPELVRSLVNRDFGVLGRTASTPAQPNTSGTFHFWLSKEAADARIIDIGSVVVAYSDDERELVFGSVNELNSVCESGSFIEDYAEHGMGDAQAGLSTEVPEVLVATCVVVRTLSSKTRPVTRSMVYFPTPQGVQFAFGMVNARGESVFHGSAVPIGIYENADGTITPVSVDENYLVGPEAAHMNVSGISGLACKTSALEFCIKSLLVHTSKKIAVLMINVKSKDLLYLDLINPRLVNDPWSRRAYESLGLPLEPFKNCRFFAPSHTKGRGTTQSLREMPTEAFRWDLQMIYQDLPALFSASDWDNNIEGAWYVIKEEIERGGIESYEGMLTWIDKLLSMSGLTEWPKGFPVATWHKLKSDLKRFTVQYRGLITEGPDGIDLPWNDLRRNQVFVVDMQMLSDGGQKLVFGNCIRAVTKLLETRSTGLDSVVVFVDELNKFAPKNEHTALKSHLIDVTARGRSLGLILFGAEQFASAVDKQIVENSSTFIFGRTESTEMEHATYTGLSEEMKSKLRMLPQGELLIKFPKFPQPIFVKFPFPPAIPGEDYRSEHDARRLLADTGHDDDDYYTAPAHRSRAIRHDDHSGGESQDEGVRAGVDFDRSTRDPRQTSDRAEERAGANAPAYATSTRRENGHAANGHGGEPGSLLKRYQAGEYEEVWAEMTALGARIRQREYFDDASAVARETMRRARQNIETIVRRLDKLDYAFFSRHYTVGAAAAPAKASPGIKLGPMKQVLQGLEDLRQAGMAAVAGDHLKDKNVFMPPGERDSAIIAEMESNGIILPLSLRAWIEEVGRVDLTGSHPKLCFMQDPDLSRGILNVTGPDGKRVRYRLTRPVTTLGRAKGDGVDIPLLNDDMVSKVHARVDRSMDNHFTIYDAGSTNGIKVNSMPIGKSKKLVNGDEILIGATKISFQHTENRRQAAVAGICADPLVVLPTAEWIQEKLAGKRSPKPQSCILFVSPFDADKAAPDPEVQIDEGYSIAVPNASADAVLTGERHNTTFVGYLRHAFRWGGFPGWDRYKNFPLDEIAALTEGLLPL